RPGRPEHDVRRVPAPLPARTLPDGGGRGDDPGLDSGRSTRGGRRAARRLRRRPLRPRAGRERVHPAPVRVAASTSEGAMPTIDADAHVLETERTWSYMTESEHEFRPQVVKAPGPSGADIDWWLIDGRRRSKQTNVGEDTPEA